MQPLSPPASASGVRTATRAVIFDLDGVLVWSVPMHWQAFRKTFAAEGREFPFDEYMRIAVSASREDVIRKVLGDVPESKLRFLMDEKERHVRDYLREKGIDLIPGSLDFVRAVRARRLKTAVASASRLPELVLGSVNAVQLFDAIVHRGMVERTKPHPDIYLRAAEILGMPPSECLVVEDTPVGVESALAAGMRVLALTTTEDPANLARASAVYKGYSDIPLDEWIPDVGPEPGLHGS